MYFFCLSRAHARGSLIVTLLARYLFKLTAIISSRESGNVRLVSSEGVCRYDLGGVRSWSDSKLFKHWCLMIDSATPTPKGSLQSSLTDEFERFSTSLDNIFHKSPSLSQWSVSQKRAYQRILSGLVRAQRSNRMVRFLTLTTSLNGSYIDLVDDFEALKKRIRREYGSFEYFRVRTKEGNGVLHVLATGSYIPQDWLSDAWCDIHKAKVVDIRLLKNSGNKLARYVISQYCTSQRLYDGYSYSHNWVFPGFVRVWVNDFLAKMAFKAKWKGPFKQLVRIEGGLDRAVAAWHTYLLNDSCWINGEVYPPLIQMNWKRLGCDGKWIGLKR